MKSHGLVQTLPPSRNSTAPRIPQTGARSSVEKLTNEAPPIGSPLAAQRRHLEAAPSAQVRRTAEEVPFEERHTRILVAERVNRSDARLHSGDDLAERAEVASLGGELVIIVGARRASCLPVRGAPTPRIRAWHRAGCCSVPAAIEADRRTRALARSGPRIEPERNQLVSERRILQRFVRDRVALEFVHVRQRQARRRAGAGTGPPPRRNCRVTVARPPFVSSVNAGSSRVPRLSREIRDRSGD